MSFDVAIVGAGIAGASLAAKLAPYTSVLLLEAEEQPGFHSTGRSNALWHQSYGGPAIEPLTYASFAEMQELGTLKERGALAIARANESQQISEFIAQFSGRELVLERVGRPELTSWIDGLTEEWVEAVFEPNSADIDVAKLHSAYLSDARKAGGRVDTRARLVAAKREDSKWRLETSAGKTAASILVNAAGAWADDVAQLAGAAPLGISPLRRTIVQLRLSREVSPNLPFIADISGQVYFRPEGNLRVWLSPADETAVPAGDVAPEELDVAIAIDRFQNVVDWPIAAVEHSWAGLRSFAPDRRPVYGFDPHVPGFFWCAGQGGFGIQTAPAAARFAASLLLDRPFDEDLASLDPGLYAPARFA